MVNSLDLKRTVIIDVDGLRRDVYQAALARVEVPNLSRLVGGPGGEKAHHVPALSVTPFFNDTATTEIYTGAHPAQHRIPGNESFDRLGHANDGKPRHYGFDVGDTLAVDDAVRVFSDGLASQLLNPDTPTIYETLAGMGKTSLVAYNMYARGATEWVAPSIIDIARFTKGRGILGLEAGKYDARMLDDLGRALDRWNQPPDLLTAYFMGLDHHSHLHGPASQSEYLRNVIDPQIGRLLELLEKRDILEGTLFVIVSDHGQIPVIDDDLHAIHLGFPFEKELEHIFEALGLDVHDKPGEDPNCDAVIALNGGLAHVYLQHRQGRWADVPRYAEDVLPVAQAFHEMTTAGRYELELQGALELILVRDAESNGWQSDYHAYLGDSRTQPLAEHLKDHPELPYADPVNRLRNLSSAMSGDLILAANGRDGFCFGGPIKGVHGSLYTEDSEAVLTFAHPDGDAEDVRTLRDLAGGMIGDRCASEGNRQPSIADMAPVLRVLWDV
jgi:hypothetical protein